MIIFRNKQLYLQIMPLSNLDNPKEAYNYCDLWGYGGVWWGWHRRYIKKGIRALQIFIILFFELYESIQSIHFLFLSQLILGQFKTFSFLKFLLPWLNHSSLFVLLFPECTYINVPISMHLYQCEWDTNIRENLDNDI